MKCLPFRIFVFFLLLVFLVDVKPSFAQQDFWHNKPRELSYFPDGEDFVLRSGTRRFNRALYGTNTGFRVEAGDLPEFALYMPGVGGNLKFGLISGNESKWIIEAASIESRYRPGSMLYKIKDPILGNATLHLTVLALDQSEGVIVKAQIEGSINPAIKLVSVFGGANGKTFSRAGDIGADPESGFYLHPEYCEGNKYSLNKSSFVLDYTTARSGDRQLVGRFPENMLLAVGDARQLLSPNTAIKSRKSNTPIVLGQLGLEKGKEYFFLIENPGSTKITEKAALPVVFAKAEKKRSDLAARVKIDTPDPYINALGGALAVAADGVWESPTYLHGAVAWRMRLNAWRGANAADPLGDHDRARLHLSSYSNSQVIEPAVGKIVADTALHLARHIEEMGTAMFSSGYISRNPNDNTRPHHYDMNLVFFDQMLSHFYWTGDISFAKEMWPAIKRHLAWEKRNFDTDGDGLYDAYCAIWASDGLQYSGGGVTHTSSYNYRSNRIAAKLAALFGDDPTPYQAEADKILKALNTTLWMPNKGWYAEYKDLLGAKMLHPWPGLWTIYHAIDAEVPDQFMAYQALRYVDSHIPHIPVRANGLEEKNLYTVATTNWQPYTWSVNNVSLAEALHTSLAYWQGGRPEEAFNLWRSNIIESLYLGPSPGNFQQLSFYDARRGALYRDFADPIGVAARTVVEGLYGIKPDALSGVLTIRPGFPESWENASLHLPHIDYSYFRKGNIEKYTIKPSLNKQMSLSLQLKARSEGIKSVKVNGKSVDWFAIEDEVGFPMVEIRSPLNDGYVVEVQWEGKAIEQSTYEAKSLAGQHVILNTKNAKIIGLNDPQQIFSSNSIKGKSFEGQLKNDEGAKTFFVQLNQGKFTWWQPVDIFVEPELEILSDREQKDQNLRFTLKNNGDRKSVQVIVNDDVSIAHKELVDLGKGELSEIVIPSKFVRWGTNTIKLIYGNEGKVVKQNISNWTQKAQGESQFETIDLASIFNDQVGNIFKNQYMSPRPQSPTLQLPWQGIGNWCYPLIEANIDDSGLRKKAGSQNVIYLPGGIPLQTPGTLNAKNIFYTSTWDNYPDSGILKLKGKASHAYLMMAGTTNPMQSHMDNAEIIVYYEDGTQEHLALRNPQNWWPIEQDFYIDDYAFDTGAAHPYRMHLKTGNIMREADKYIDIKGFTERAIDGGAATILDMPLNPNKTLKELKLKTLTNDVVVGLMSLTLLREDK